MAPFLAVWSALLLLTTGLGVRADMHRYTDDSGRTHIVDTIEKIPEKYRDQVKTVPTPSSPSRDRAPGSGGYPAKPSDSRVQPRVDIYVTSWCGYCRKLEQFLKSRRIRYTRHDIERSRSAHDRYRKLGGSGVPLITVGADVIRGFNTEAILGSLGRHR